MVVVYVLLVLLALIAIVLFTPVRYKVGGHIGDQTRFTVDAMWLLHLLRVSFVYDTERSFVTVRVAGFLLHKPKKRKQDTHIMKTKPKKEKPTKEKDIPPKKLVRHEQSNEKEPSNRNEKTNDKTKEPTAGLLTVWNKVKAVLTYPDRKIIMSLCMRFLRYVKHAIWPKHLDIEGVIGLEDPAHTGWLIGVYETTTCMLGLRRDIRIMGDFTQAMLRLKFQIWGRISIGGLLWPMIWLLTRRPVFRLIRRLIKKTD